MLRRLENTDVELFCECLENEASENGKLTYEIFEKCLSKSTSPTFIRGVVENVKDCEKLYNLVRSIQSNEICTSIHHYLIYLNAQCIELNEEDVSILRSLYEDPEKGAVKAYRRLIMLVVNERFRKCIGMEFLVAIYSSLLSIAQLYVQCREGNSSCEHILRGLRWRIRTLLDAYSQGRKT